MRKKRIRQDLALLVLSSFLYLLGRFWLRWTVQGWLHWFLVCYYSDVLAGVFILSWLDLMLAAGRRGRVHSWKQTVPFLLACGVVWECMAPLWKAGAVFDLWDFVAYQAGGALYLTAIWLWSRICLCSKRGSPPPQ